MFYRFKVDQLVNGLRVTIRGDEQSFIDIYDGDSTRDTLEKLHDMYERGVRDGIIKKGEEIKKILGI